MLIVTAALFTIPQKCKKSKCPQKCKKSKCPWMDEWINKMWYIHTMAYYSA
jgi:hypothetical protein